MDFKSYREIILSYANSHGKGLPLTAEEYCNAMALYIQEVLPEYQNETLAYIKDQIENGGLIDSYIASVVNASTIDTIVSWADDNFNNYAKAFFEDENDWFGNYLTTKADRGDLDAMFGYGLASSGAIHGSDTIVVDTVESGDGVEIHLDGEVVSKIERSVKTPLSNPTEPALPVLGVNGATEWEPVSSIVNGNSKSIYLTVVSFRAPLSVQGEQFTVELQYIITSTKQVTVIDNDFIYILSGYFVNDGLDGSEQLISNKGIINIEFRTRYIETPNELDLWIVRPTNKISSGSDYLFCYACSGAYKYAFIHDEDISLDRFSIARSIEV